MPNMRSLALLISLVLAVTAEQFSYEGYKVYRVQVSGENQLKTLASLSQNKHFDFWSPLRDGANPIDVMVDPSAQTTFARFLAYKDIKYEVLIDNVEGLVQQERMWQMLAPRQEGRISFTKYNNHGEINAYLDTLAADYPNLVSVESIGKSYEGRDLKIIKISSNSSANKPVIFIDAGIHAREWAAPAQATYITNQLVENSNNAHLLELVDWHILPVVNPDGYEYTHNPAGKRFWRKTRSVGKECIGTDGNRNFGFHWGEIGASTNECDDTYMGKSAFSEPETIAVRDYVTKHKANIKLYLTFHSYGKYILFPWGFTSEVSDDFEELQALGERVANAISAVAGSTYKVGSSTNVLYAAAGGSDDWAKGEAGVELSYTIELPGGGLLGFNPPPKQILPIVTETWEGVKEYHNYIAGKFGRNNV